MANVLLAIIGVALIGVENSLEISNLKVQGASTAGTTYTMTIKNLKSESISFFALVESTYKDIPQDVYAPLKMLPATIGASETREFSFDVKCRIFCASDGSYRSGHYQANANFWKLAQDQPVICQTDPWAFECGYVQIAPPVSTVFTVEPAAIQITFKAQACYQVFVSGGFVNCSEIVPTAEGSITPSGTVSALSGSTQTFTATAIEGKSKFVKWIKADGCSSLGCKTSESTINPFTSAVLQGQIYTAVFEKIIPPPQVAKPKLTIMITNPASCTSTPAPGVYEKNLNDKLTITMTPSANITSSDGKSVRVSGIIGYTIMKSNNPIPDTTTYDNDNLLMVGTKSAKTTKEITMDVDTEVILSCVSTDVLDGRKPPTQILPPGMVPTGINLPAIGLGAVGAVILVSSVFVGRKGAIM
jgi:hypothetical protein